MKYEQQSNPDRIINRAEFDELKGMSRTSIWGIIQSCDAPQVKKLNGLISGFRESSYNNRRVANSNA